MGPLLEGAGNVPQQSFVQWNDPHGNKLIALNRDGTIDCLGVNTGGEGAPIPVNNEYAVTHGLSGAMQTVRVPYLLTSTDIIRGYAYVDIEYPYAWPDLNETNLFTVCNPDQTDGTDFAPGCVYDRRTTGMSAILNLTAAVPIVQGQGDFLDLTTGYGYSFTPLMEGIYAITIVATSIAPQGTFPAGVSPQVNFDVTYTDHAGVEYNDGIVSIVDNLQSGQILNPIYSLASEPITIFSSYVTFGIAGKLASPFVLKGTGSTTPNSVVAPATATGPGAAYGATLTQTNPDGGCTAFFFGYITDTSIGLAANGPILLYTVLSGTDDFGTSGGDWVDAASGTSYSSNGSISAGGFFGAGSGVRMFQFVTYARGLENNNPTPSPDPSVAATLYLGPHVSGVPDIPSGYIDIPNNHPSTTHAYAWFDEIDGGVFVPTAAWVTSLPTTDGPRVVFPYNEHIRIVQMPNNSTIYTPGMTTYLNFLSIHD